jgi:hypothetical protein
MPDFTAVIRALASPPSLGSALECSIQAVQTAKCCAALGGVWFRRNVGW